MLILSMSPEGMEDVPYSVLSQLTHYSKKIGFDSLLLIDSHNAMGDTLDAQQTERLLKTAERCLDKLVTAVEYPFRAGFANIKDIPIGVVSKTIWVSLDWLCLHCALTTSGICWAGLTPIT